MDCIFCKIVAGEIPARVLFRDEEITAFYDVNPAAPTHILVIPNQHIDSLDELTPDTVDLAGHLLLACKRAAAETGLSESGYRVVTNVGEGAGQSVQHLHLHVLGKRRMSWPPG